MTVTYFLEAGGVPPLTVHSRSGAAWAPRQGVKGLQSATLNRLRWQWQRYPWSEDDVAVARTPLIFVDHVADARWR